MYEYEEFKTSELIKQTAEYISRGLVIGWYQGRSESGPRALGNRSILADPRPIDMKDKINNKVKHREPYRPFAPSVLLEHTKDWFEDIEESKYMLKICKVKPEKQSLIPAVMHIDGTARIQTVP